MVAFVKLYNDVGHTSSCNLSVPLLYFSYFAITVNDNSPVQQCEIISKFKLAR